MDRTAQCTAARDFDTDLFRVNCAQMLDTANGDCIYTVVEEYTIPLYSGTLFDTVLTVVVDANFYDKMYLPSSTESEYINLTVYEPPHYVASLTGTIGVASYTAYADVVAMINAPYCITSVNPIPLSVPSNTLGAILSVTSITKALHSYSEVAALLTMYPESNCYIDGNFVLEFFVECLPEDPTCDGGVLQDFTSFTTDVFISIPHCGNENSTLYISTYYPNGSFAVSLQPGQTITIDEYFITDAGIPDEDCDCKTDVDLYDWSGNLLGHHNVETEAQLFHTTLLFVSPLENKFSVYLDPSIFCGVVGVISATCDINWGNGQAAQAVSGYAIITVGIDDSSGEDRDHKTAMIIGVILGLVTAGVVAGVQFSFLDTKSAENRYLPLGDWREFSGGMNLFGTKMVHKLVLPLFEKRYSVK
ncbi:hypothetical protein Pelo_3612 [Pelomyxa schiedti]|nr:hypothetical protein Pelo_3612 [Pelomyxa schiedti]